MKKLRRWLLPSPPVFSILLWYSANVDVFMVVSEYGRAIPVHGTGGAVSRRSIAVERPEPGGDQLVGFNEGTYGIDVVQARDLVLRIILTEVYGQSNVLKGDARLLIERLRSSNRRLAHIAAVVRHHAVVGVGGAVIHRHQVDDVITSQTQSLDLVDHRSANASTRDRIGG